MKRAIVSFIVCLALLTSCSKKQSAEDVVLGLIREYPIDSIVYSSRCEKVDEGYIDEQMLVLLFGVDEYPVDDFALVLYGKVDIVQEIGVFFTHNSDERMKVTMLLSERIALLDSLSNGEGFIKKYRSAIVYGFVDDPDRVISIFDKLM